MRLDIEPIGHVRGGRALAGDDNGDGRTAQIVLNDDLEPEA